MGFSLVTSPDDATALENQRLSATDRADDMGNNKKRKCTDCFFTLALVACWLAMTALGFTAMGVIDSPDIPAGDPSRLVNGVDYQGRICGSDAGVRDRPALYPLTEYRSVCLAACPASAQEEELCVDEVCGAVLASTDVLNYCIVSGSGNSTTELGRKGADAYEETVADLWLASGYIGGFGFCVAMFFGFCYLRLLRVPGVVTTMVWGSIFFLLVVLYLCASTAVDQSKAWAREEPQAHTDTYVQAMAVLGYLFYGAAALFVCVIMYLRRRISLAVGVVKEASRAVGAMPALILLPVWQAAGVLAFLVPWLVYALYLASAGEIRGQTVAGVGYKTVEYSSNVRYALFFHLFCYYWTSEFVVAVGHICIAMAVSTWYFTRNKSEIKTGTVARAVKQTLFYHMGSAAFGSLVIAVIKTLRAVLAYLQKKCAKSDMRAAQFLLACLSCCLWCVEKCMRFLNDSAYVLIAIKGDPFCTSCKEAFFLILRNLDKIAAVAIVGQFVLFIGKIAITVCTAGAAYQAMAYSLDDELNGLVAPVVMVSLLAFFTAAMFCSVFDMAIHTLLLSYVADEEMFEPSRRYAEGSLKKWVAVTQQEAAKQVELGEVPASSMPLVRGEEGRDGDGVGDEAL